LMIPEDQKRTEQEIQRELNKVLKDARRRN
jgi:hypothetical protein